MESVLIIPLGVTIAREAIVSPWADHIWRPVSVFLGAEPLSTWRLLERREGFEHYHAATLPLELHRTETAGYLATLMSDDPGIRVVLRPGSASVDGIEPMHVHLITASAHDAEAYGASGDEIVSTVAMPEPVRELVEAFVAHHHKEEVFKKRKRRNHHEIEAHQFGQEPIHVLRARMAERGRKPE